MRDNTTYYVFSVYRGQDATQDKLNHLEQLQALSGTNKEVLGCYKGTQELSIVTALPLDKVLNIAMHYGQESILVLESDNTAKLLMVSSGETKTIGKLEQVTKDEALRLDSWSYRADLDQYYAIKVGA